MAHVRHTPFQNVFLFAESRLQGEQLLTPCLQACPKDVSPTGFWPPVLLEGPPSLGPQNEDSLWEFTAADPGRELCVCVCMHAHI